ncbi:MAG TPA: Do family serine endopeptidase [Patescibacteria group bacterium]|nr:Do family serine endopeptidase [Patescibacteria group bacterium]
MRTDSWSTSTAGAPAATAARAARPAPLLATLALGLLAGAALAFLAGRALLTRGAPGSATSTAPETGSETPSTGPATAPITPPAPGEGYAPIARAVMPSVVNISSLQVIKTYERYSPFMADPFFQQFFGGGGYDYVVPRERRELSLGSGVIADPKGIILTNNHVVEHATEVKVALSDGRELPAKIIGVDTRTDLAALKVAESGLPSAVLGDSDKLQVGDIVLAFGNPFGLGGTVTMGIVSAIGRGNIGVADYEDFIQTDAAINPGNSGGALVDTRGEVIGINTAILSQSGGYQGVGFAIPANMVREVVDSLIKNGRVIRGYSGLALQGITPDLARAFGLPDTHGALVTALDPQGPAAEAGLRRGDVIVSLKGRPVATDDELRTQMSRLKPGDRTTLGVLRSGRRMDVDLLLVEPPETQHPRRRG